MEATYICQECNKEFKDSWNARPKYCPECRDKRIKSGKKLEVK